MIRPVRLAWVSRAALALISLFAALMRQASYVMRHASCVIRHASCIRRHGRAAVALISLFAALPLLQPGFLATSDAHYHLYRIVEMAQSLRQGIFPVRWAPDFAGGLGYPLFNFTPPVTYWLGALAYAAGKPLGLDAIAAWKAVAVMAMLLGGQGMFGYCRRFLPPAGALLAAAAFVHTPYLLGDLYHRGDLSEVVAIAWLPWTLWSFNRLAERPSPTGLALAAAAYAALILTHAVVALIFSPFLALYGFVVCGPWFVVRRARTSDQGPGIGFLVSGFWFLVGRARATDQKPETRNQKLHGEEAAHSLQAFILVGLALGLGLAVSAFFWLPALGERNQVAVERLLYSDFRGEFLDPGRLIAAELVHPYATLIVDAPGRQRHGLGLVQTALAGAGLAVVVVLALPGWRRRRSEVSAKNVVYEPAAPGGPGAEAPTRNTGAPRPTRATGEPAATEGPGAEAPTTNKGAPRLVAGAHGNPRSIPTCQGPSDEAPPTSTGTPRLVVGASAHGSPVCPEISAELIRTPLLLAGLAAAAIFFTLPASLPLWERLPLLPYVQFPWRFLGIAAVPLAALAGCVARIPGRAGRMAAILGLPLVVAVSLLDLRPISLAPAQTEASLAGATTFELLYNTIGTTTRGEFLPAGVESPTVAGPAVAALADRPMPIFWRTEPPGAVQGEAVPPTARTEAWLPTWMRPTSDLTRKYRIEAAAPARIVLPLTFFPGWRATLDGAPAPLEASRPEGLTSIAVPAGLHTLDLVFTGTRLERIADLLSIAGLAALSAIAGLPLLRLPARLRQSATKRPGSAGPGSAGVPPARVHQCGRFGRQDACAPPEQPALAAPGRRDACAPNDQAAPANRGRRGGCALNDQPASANRGGRDACAPADDPSSQPQTAASPTTSHKPRTTNRPGREATISTRPPLTRNQKPETRDLAPLHAVPAIILGGALLVQAGLFGGHVPAEGYPIVADLADGTRVVGATVRSATAAWDGGLVVAAGEVIGVQLTTRDGTGQTVERPVTLRLTNATGVDWAVAGGSSGDEIALTLPTGLPPGPYRIEATVADAAGEPVRPVRFHRVGMLPIGGQIQLGPILVKPEPRPSPEPPLATAGGVIELLEAAVEMAHRTAGGALTPGPSPVRRERGERGALTPGPSPTERGEVAPTSSYEFLRVPTSSYEFLRVPSAPAGSEILVRTRWRAIRPLAGNLRISLHLVDEWGLVWAARDVEPTAGLFPPLLWWPGEVVEDRTVLPIPAEMRPGTYRLQLRVLSSAEALPMTDREGRTTPVFDVGPAAVLPAERIGPPVAGAAPIARSDLALVRAAVGPAVVPPGGRLTVDLVWVALRHPRPVVAGVLLAGPDGSHPLMPPVSPGGPTYPAERWRPGERVRDQWLATIPRTLAAGQYRVVVQIGPRSGDAVAAEFVIGAVTVETRDRRPPPPPERRVESRLANGVVLVGYDLTPKALAAGGTATVGLHWRAERMVERNLSVSVQLLDAGGRLVAQHDGVPGNGRAPIPGWLVGEEVLDEHPLALPPALPPGRYRLIAVLYDPGTGERIAGVDGGDTTLLDELTAGL